MLLHDFLPIHGFLNPILLSRVVKDRLVDQEFTVAHARYLLQEVDRVELHIIARFIFDGASTTVIALRLDIQLLVQCGDINLYQVFDVLRLAEL